MKISQEGGPENRGLSGPYDKTDPVTANHYLLAKTRSPMQGSVAMKIN